MVLRAPPHPFYGNDRVNGTFWAYIWLGEAWLFIYLFFRTQGNRDSKLTIIQKSIYCFKIQILTVVLVWGQYSIFWVFIWDWNYFFCRNKNKHIAIFVFKNKCLLSPATRPFWPEISLFWPSQTFLQVSLSKPSKHIIRNKIKHGCSRIKWFKAV